MIDMGDKVKTLGCSTTASLHAQMRLQYSVSTPSAHLGKTVTQHCYSFARLVKMRGEERSLMLSVLLFIRYICFVVGF